MSSGTGLPAGKSVNPGFRGPVCYVLDFLPTYVAGEIRELAEQGVSIRVHLPGETPVTALWDRVVGDCPVGCTRDLKLSWCGLPALRFLSKAMPCLLRALIRHPLTAGSLLFKSLGTGTFRYFAVAVRLCEVPDIRNSAVIHAHFAKDSAHIARYASALTGVPFTVTTHATDIFCPQNSGWVALLLRDAAGVHTISGFNRDYMAERWGGELRKRITVARLGIDPGSLPERVLTGGVPSLVCTASGLVPKKGLAVLIDACEILAERGVDFTCSVIGSDPGGDRLETFRREAGNRGLGRRVLMEGLLSAGETLARVSSCSVFVMPSVAAPNGDKDGIPVSLMEAMGIGVPSVSTRLSGIPELMEDGVSGLLVEPADPHALADALERLLTDTALAERLGAAGRLKVRSDFTVSRYAHDLMAFWGRSVKKN